MSEERRKKYIQAYNDLRDHLEAHNFDVFEDDLFELDIDGTVVGKYEMASSSPFDSQNRARVFIPSVKFEAASGNVTKATISILSWDSVTEQYVALTDLTLFKEALSEFIFVPQEGSNMQSIDLKKKASGSNFVVESSDMTQTFTTSGVSIGISYVMFGNSYQWQFSAQ